MSSKEARLRKRLDDLESELKSLHVRVASKRNSAHPDKIQQNVKNCNDRNQSKNAKGNASKLANKRKVKESWGEKNPLFMKEDCWSFLRNISKNIAKGTEAINKIASFTEISGISGRGDSKNLFDNVHQRSNRDFPLQYPGGDHELNGRKKSVDKPLKKFRFSQTTLERGATPPTRMYPEMSNIQTSPITTSDNYEVDIAAIRNDRNFSSEIESLKCEMEERLLDLQILREKIENLKRRLRDERSKREIAEKALASYKRRLQASEEKKLKEEKESTELLQTLKQEKITSVELELKSEIKKRMKAEKKINDLLTELEESRNEISKLEDSRRLALSMVDRFRDQLCTHNPHELENLRAEKAALQEEIMQIQQRAESVLVEKLVERTEYELVEKMRQCNSVIARSSINDPDVQEVIEHHKAAYAELELELEHKETELLNQQAAFEKELEEIKSIADKKQKELSQKYSQAKSLCEENDSIIKKLQAGKCILEKEIEELKKQLQDISTENTELQKEVDNLKDILIQNKDEVEKLKRECAGNEELHHSLEEKYKNLTNIVNDKDQQIETLRMELEKEKDTVKIKEKILQDQVDTIKCLRTVSENTKKTLDDERAQKRKLKEEVNKLQLSHQVFQREIQVLDKRLKQSQEVQLTLKKSNESMKLHATQVSSQKEVLLNRLAQMTYEKDQAIETAKSTTEKLVQTINEYELKLITQKEIHNILKGTLREKDYQLDVANQQIRELNEELWKSARTLEKMRSDLQSKLKSACEVCTDVLDIQFENDL